MFISCRDDGNSEKLITDWMERMHAVVIGPGLGRDKDLLDTVQVVPNPKTMSNSFTQIILHLTET